LTLTRSFVRGQVAELGAIAGDADERDLLKASVDSLHVKLANALSKHADLNEKVQAAEADTAREEQEKEQLQDELNEATMSHSNYNVEIASLQAELATAQVCMVGAPSI